MSSTIISAPTKNVGMRPCLPNVERVTSKNFGIISMTEIVRREALVSVVNKLFIIWHLCARKRIQTHIVDRVPDDFLNSTFTVHIASSFPSQVGNLLG